MLSKAALINSEIKSDLIYAPSAEERGDICSHLNGVVKRRERSCSADFMTVHAPAPLPVCSLLPWAVPTIPAPWQEPGRESSELDAQEP